VGTHAICDQLQKDIYTNGSFRYKTIVLLFQLVKLVNDLFCLFFGFSVLVFGYIIKMGFINLVRMLIKVFLNLLHSVVLVVAHMSYLLFVCCFFPLASGARKLNCPRARCIAARTSRNHRMQISFQEILKAKVTTDEAIIS